MTFNVTRKVNLKDVVKKYGKTPLLSGPSPHNSKLIPAVEKAEASGIELWIEDRGCKLNSIMPAFYEVNIETGDKDEAIPFKKNQYFYVNPVGFQMSCHSLSALALVENPDPNECLAPDHICNPDDSQVLYETKMHYDLLLAYAEREGKSWIGLEPDKINWSPNNLQWIERGENTNKSNNTKTGLKKKHQRFVSRILNYDNDIRKSFLDDLTFSHDCLENFKDTVGHGKYIEKLCKNYKWEDEEMWYSDWQDRLIREWEILDCLQKGEWQYIEDRLIQNKIYGGDIEIPEDITDVSGGNWRGIPLLDFIEKYIARCHMKDWDDSMRKKVTAWIKWVANYGNSEEPKLKIVGHKLLGPKGNLKSNNGDRYIFEQLCYFCMGLYYSEDDKKQILSKHKKESFKLMA